MLFCACMLRGKQTYMIFNMTTLLEGMQNCGVSAECIVTVELLWIH